MAMQAHTIRKALNGLVAYRLVELGCAGFTDHSRRFPHQELFEGDLCPMVNPGCPTDLCYLPANHVGTAEKFHITGTTAYDWAIKWEHATLAPVGTSREELVKLGALLAQTLWPD